MCAGYAYVNNQVESVNFLIETHFHIPVFYARFLEAIPQAYY